MCYHGAFVTGKSLHEEHWIDLGGGALKKQGFCLAQRDVTLPSNAKADTALTEYTVSGSRTRAVNGKYRFAGYSDEVPYFTNENNISIFMAVPKGDAKFSIFARGLGALTAGFQVGSGNQFSKSEGSRIDGDVGKHLLELNATGVSKITCQATGAISAVVKPQSRHPANNLIALREYSKLATLGSEIDRNMAFVSAGNVPPLCLDWVLLTCPRRLTKCRRRHYYVSQTERDGWVERRGQCRQTLDLKVLRCILRREALLENLHTVAFETKKSYLEFHGSTRGLLASMLVLLDQLRVAGVECAESIALWSKHCGLRNCDALGVHQKGRWIATIESEGHQLWGEVPAVHSKFRRYQRDALPPKRARITKFLGIYSQ